MHKIKTVKSYTKINIQIAFVNSFSKNFLIKKLVHVHQTAYSSDVT